MAFDPFAGLSPQTTTILAGAAGGALVGAAFGALTGPRGDKAHDATHFGWIGVAVGTVAGVFAAGLGQAPPAAVASSS